MNPQPALTRVNTIFGFVRLGDRINWPSHFNRRRRVAFFADRKRLSLAGVLASDASPGDRVQIACTSQLAPFDFFVGFACDCVDRALRCERDAGRPTDSRTWSAGIAVQMYVRDEIDRVSMYEADRNAHRAVADPGADPYPLNDTRLAINYDLLRLGAALTSLVVPICETALTDHLGDAVYRIAAGAADIARRGRAGDPDAAYATEHREQLDYLVETFKYQQEAKATKETTTTASRTYTLDFSPEQWDELSSLSFPPFTFAEGDALTRGQWMALAEMALGKIVRIKRGDYGLKTPDFNPRRWVADLDDIVDVILNAFQPGDGKI